MEKLADCIEIAPIPVQGYVLYFRFDELNLPLADRLTGHGWEVLIEAYCGSHEISIAALDIDSEADSLAVYADDVVSLTELGLAISRLLKLSASERQKLLADASADERGAVAEQDADWTAEEFIEHLQLNQINTQAEVRLVFFLDVDTEERATAIIKALKTDGYLCYMDASGEQFSIACQVTAMPETERLNQLMEYFQGICETFAAESDDFDLWDDYCLDEAEDWHLC